MKWNIPVYTDLFSAFFKIGICTFGGGMSMLPMLQQELVQNKNWLTEEEILNYFAIGQCTPGIIAVNVATFCGYKRGGVLGACIATLGIVCPSWIVITIIAGAISNFADIAWLNKAMQGVYAVVAALLTRTVWTFGKKILKDAAALAIAAAACAGMAVYNVPGIVIVCVSGAVGCGIQVLRQRYGRS